MSIGPVTGEGVGPSGPLPFAKGELLEAQVLAALGDKRYRVVVAGRVLEAISGVGLILGQTVLARVRHAGPPLVLEIEGDPGAAPGQILARAVPPAPASLEPVLGRIQQALESLRAVLPERLRGMLDPASLPRSGAADLHRVLESLAALLLSGDPELSRIDRRIERFTDPKARGVLAHLLAEEERRIAEKPWAAPLRRAAGMLQEHRGEPEAVFPFEGAWGSGVLRVEGRARSSRGRARPSVGDGASVGILLEMSRLGLVGALLRESSGSLQVDFSVERAETERRIRAESRELARALGGEGFNAGVAVRLEPRRAIEDAVLDPEPPSGPLDVVG